MTGLSDKQVLRGILATVIFLLSGSLWGNDPWDLALGFRGEMKPPNSRDGLSMRIETQYADIIHYAKQFQTISSDAYLAAAQISWRHDSDYVAIFGGTNRAQLHVSDTADAIEICRNGDQVGSQFAHQWEKLYFGGRLAYKHNALALGLWGRTKIQDCSCMLRGAIDPIAFKCKTDLADNEETIPIQGNIYGIGTLIDLQWEPWQFQSGIEMGWTFPRKPNDEGNQTELSGNFVSITLFASHMFGTFQFGPTINYSYGRIDAEFSQDGTRFAYLDSAAITSLSARIDAKWSKFSAGLGYSYINGAVGNGSFFEAWPFSYWDFFAASKYRIVRLKSDVSDFLVFFNRSGDIICGGATIHFLFSQPTQFIHKKRVAIIYPIVFCYEYDSTEVLCPFDGLVEFSLTINIPMGNSINGSVFLHQIIPFSYGDGIDNPENVAGIEHVTHGGTFVGAAFELFTEKKTMSNRDMQKFQ